MPRARIRYSRSIMFIGLTQFHIGHDESTSALQDDRVSEGQIFFHFYIKDCKWVYEANASSLSHDPPELPDFPLKPPSMSEKYIIRFFPSTSQVGPWSLLSPKLGVAVL